MAKIINFLCFWIITRLTFTEYQHDMKQAQLLWRVSIFLMLVILVSSSNIFGDRQDMGLTEDGGYTDMLVAINEDVPEDSRIIFKLKVGFDLIMFET